MGIDKILAFLILKRSLIKKLNGTIVFIMGNHDKALKIEQVHPVLSRLIINYKGENILLIHSPYDKNKGHSEWNGWMIHGHTHNNQLDEYPLINNNYKTINVSCELLDYTPIEIGRLLGRRDKS